MGAKKQIKLNYKQLRLSDEYLYSSEEEQEKEQEKQEEKQDKKPFDLDDLIELIINREKLPINNELLKNIFNLKTPFLCIKFCTKHKIKKKKVNY